MFFAGILSIGLLTPAYDVPSFDDVTKPSDDSGDSINGKSIASFKAEVQKLWPTIDFKKEGKDVKYTAKMETDDGTIEIEFFTDKAPNHSRNFICLAKAGYYDGLKFHRVIDGFMCQGGCPKGNGTGGPGYMLKNEFNDIKHEKGILSTARQGRDVNSGGSQFFLMLGTSPHLDNQYTVFGKVSKGLDVIDKIAARPNADRETPRDPCTIKKVTISVKE